MKNREKNVSVSVPIHSELYNPKFIMTFQII